MPDAKINVSVLIYTEFDAIEVISTTGLFYPDAGYYSVPFSFDNSFIFLGVIQTSNGGILTFPKIDVFTPLQAVVFSFPYYNVYTLDLLKISLKRDFNPKGEYLLELNP